MMTKNRSETVVTYENEIKNLREKITSIEFNYELEKKDSENELFDKNLKMTKMEELLNQKMKKINEIEKMIDSNQNLQLIKELTTKLEKAERKIIEYEKTINQYEKNLLNEKRKKRASISKNISYQSSFNNSKEKNELNYSENLIKEKLEKGNSFSEETNIKSNIYKRRSSMNNFIKSSFSFLDELKKNAQIDHNMELNFFPVEEVNKPKETNYNDMIESLQKIINEEEQIKNEFELIIARKTKENKELYKTVENLELNIFETEELRENLIKELDECKNENILKDLNIKKLKKTIFDLEKEQTEIYRKLNFLEDKVKSLEKEKNDLEVIMLKDKNMLKKNSTIFEDHNNMLINENKEKEKKLRELGEKLLKVIEKNEFYEMTIDKINQEKMEIKNNLTDNLENMEKSYFMEISNLHNKITELTTGEKNITNRKNSQSKFGKDGGIKENLGGLEIDPEILENDFCNDHIELSFEDSEFKTKINKEMMNSSLIEREDSVEEKNFEIEELEKKIEELNDKNLSLIETIEQKEEEIQSLRKKCINYEENNKYISLEDHHNKVKLLMIDINDLKKNMEINQNDFEKKEKQYIKDFKEMTENCLLAKLKNTELISEIDSVNMNCHREIRKLKIQVEMYEKEITSFNQNIKSR